MKYQDLLVPPDAHVKIGQNIARVGSEGMSTGPHLHFEVHIDNQRTDPIAFLNAQGVTRDPVTPTRAPRLRGQPVDLWQARRAMSAVPPRLPLRRPGWPWSPSAPPPVPRAGSAAAPAR